MSALTLWLTCLAAIVLIGYGVPPIAAGIILGVAWGIGLGRRRQRAVTLRRLR